MPKSFASKSVTDNLIPITELIDERERLTEIIEAAKHARHARAQVDKMIALYSQMGATEIDNVVGLHQCSLCERSFNTAGGLNMHRTKVHGPKPRRKAAK